MQLPASLPGASDCYRGRAWRLCAAPGTTANGAFTNWTNSNTPDLCPAADQPASVIVIVYNSTADGACTETVTPGNVVGSASPDAVGNYGAYFVGDFSLDETLSQFSFLTPGSYRVGFSYYPTNNSLANINNFSFEVTILGIPVAMTNVTGASQCG